MYIRTLGRRGASAPTDTGDNVHLTNHNTKDFEVTFDKDYLIQSFLTFSCFYPDIIHSPVAVDKCFVS